MLVKLYALPPLPAVITGMAIRRAMAPEKETVVAWVRRSFGRGWAGECDIAFSSRPISCFVAASRRGLAGFACYDATYRGFFGPTGVSPTMRRRGIGTALLIASLHAMAAQGYAYAVIGAAGSAAFYAKAVGATSIEGSSPGPYRGLLRAPRRRTRV